MLGERRGVSPPVVFLVNKTRRAYAASLAKKDPRGGRLPDRVTMAG